MIWFEAFAKRRGTQHDMPKVVDSPGDIERAALGNSAAASEDARRQLDVCARRHAIHAADEREREFGALIGELRRFDGETQSTHPAYLDVVQRATRLWQEFMADIGRYKPDAPAKDLRWRVRLV